MPTMRGSSSTDVYACGKTGTLVHSTGGAFTNLAGNPLGTEDFATHRLPLSEAPQAYRQFQEKTDGTVKVVFKP